MILGTGNHLWWLAAVALLYLYATQGRGSPGTTPPAGSGTPPAGSGTPPAGSGTPPAGSGTPSAGPGAQPDSYRAYRERRDRQARWERRYRRERPFETRRQHREKAR
ncbi:hypothetical protein GCM10010521_05280 [Streptomyces rameus]|uniref:Uncharacterized protein n=1 Tax=Streptomyces rameus TaxID=68261 RepID=A0ABP6MSA4_9ACTN